MHPLEDSHVQMRSLEARQLILALFELLVPLLSVQQQVPPVGVRNEILRLPAIPNPVETGSLFVEDLVENWVRHVTASSGDDNLGVGHLGVGGDGNVVAGR